MPLAHILAPQLARKAEEIAAVTGHPSPSYLAQVGVTGGATPYGNVHDTAQAALDPNAAKAYLTGVNQTLDTRAIDGVGPAGAAAPNPYAGPYGAGQAAFGDLGSRGGDAFAGGFDQGADAGRAVLLAQPPVIVGSARKGGEAVRGQGYLAISNGSKEAKAMRAVKAAISPDLQAAALRGAGMSNPDEFSVPDALMMHALVNNVPVGDVPGVRKFFGEGGGRAFYTGINQGFAQAGLDPRLRGAVNSDTMVRGEMQPGALDLSKPLIIPAPEVPQKKGAKKAKAAAPTRILIPGNMAYLNQVPNVRTLERGNPDVYAGDTDPFAQKILGYPNDPTVY